MEGYHEATEEVDCIPIDGRCRQRPMGGAPGYLVRL